MKSRLLLYLLSICVPAMCQVDRATLTGTVRDPSGAVIENARVALRYAATGLTRAVLSKRRKALPAGIAP
jgi:hypothetical protein